MSDDDKTIISCVERLGWREIIMQDKERNHPNDRLPHPHGFRPGSYQYRSEAPDFTEDLNACLELINEGRVRGFGFKCFTATGHDGAPMFYAEFTKGDCFYPEWDESMPRAIAQSFAKTPMPS